MLDYLRHLVSGTSQGAPARADQVQNSAGGFTFALDPWKRLERFLILGCDGGTYYASERQLVVENAKSVDAVLSLDGPRAVSIIAAISDEGRAPKNDPAIFALAMAAAHPDDATRKAALEALPVVCRTAGSELRKPSHPCGFVRFSLAHRRTAMAG